MIHPHFFQVEAVAVDNFQPSLAQPEEVEKQHVNGAFNTHYVNILPLHGVCK